MVDGKREHGQRAEQESDLHGDEQVAEGNRERRWQIPAPLAHDHGQRIGHVQSPVVGITLRMM
jgi:hypothetical protein